MSNITNATPRTVLLGVDDKSIRTPLPEAVALPIHLPHTWGFAERGTPDPSIMVGVDLLRSYGVKTFEYRSEYATHQTVLVNALNAEGNYQMFKRLIPADASKASIVLWAEVITHDVPLLERLPDGRYKYDVNGDTIPTGATVAGHKVRYYFEQSTDLTDPSKESPHAGVMTGSDAGASSMCYPLLGLLVSSEGAYGNNIGIRFSAPDANFTEPTDEDVVADEKAFIYRIQMVERPDEISTPKTVRTVDGAQFIDFTFKKDVINRKTDQELNFAKMVLPAYNDATPGFTPIQGPMNAAYVYHENLEPFLTMLADAENTAMATMLEPHEINFAGLSNHAGVPYSTIIAEGLSMDSALLLPNATHYFSGGKNGDISADNFDTMVAAYVDNWGLGDYPLMDTAKYPCSCIYDTGFKIDTKKKLLIPMGLRKDMYTILSTQDVMEPINTVAVESSIAIVLRTAARMFPESSYYGTHVCRAAVIGHAGTLVGANYPNIVPLVIDLAIKCAKYMGSAKGYFKPGMAFDRAPMNHVTAVKDISHAWKPDVVRNKDWSSGLVWVQNYDINRQFYPGMQTVYDNDTSVLNNIPTMIAIVELEKIAERVWRDLTGDSSLTQSQFIDLSDKMIREHCKDRFDKRFIIIPATSITPADNARGYSWHTVIKILANNMKTVNVVTIEADRMESLNE